MLNETDLSNWFLNSYFDEWTNDWPDWWRTDAAGVTQPTNITYDLADWIYGGRACKMELALGEGIYYDMPGNDCDNFFGDNVYLGIHFKGVSGKGTVRFTLDDGVNTKSVDYTFDGAQTEWKRPDVRMKIDPNVTRIRAIIKCVATGGGNIEVLADAIMFSRIYDFPMAPQFVPQSHYTLIPIYFYISQPNVGGPVLMNHQGGAAADVFPVSVDTYIHKIRIFEGTAQGPTTTDTFRVLLNGNPTSLTAALTGGTQAGAAHYAPGITFAEGDRLAVDAEATDPTTPTPGQTVGACVEGYVFNK